MRYSNYTVLSKAVLTNVNFMEYFYTTWTFPTPDVCLNSGVPLSPQIMWLDDNLK